MLDLLDLSEQNNFITIINGETILKTHNYKSLNSYCFKNNIPCVHIHKMSNQLHSYSMGYFNDNLEYHLKVKQYDNPQFLYDWFEHQKKLLALYELIK